MAALADNRQTKRKDGNILSIPAGVDIIYRGGLVSAAISNGYALAGQDTAGHVFQGVAYEKVDNSGGSNGDKSVRVYRNGIFSFAASGMAQADVGKPVYILDDQTVTLVPGNVFCGRIAYFESATEVWVDIGPAVGLDAKKEVSASVKTIAGDIHALAFVCPANKQATILAAKVVAMVVPNYATSAQLNLYKYDLSATTEEAVLETANYNLAGLTAKQSADLTLQTTTPANLDMEAGDALYIKASTAGAETTAGEIGVTFEIALG